MAGRERWTVDRWVVRVSEWGWLGVVMRAFWRVGWWGDDSDARKAV